MKSAVYLVMTVTVDRRKIGVSVLGPIAIPVMDLDEAFRLEATSPACEALKIRRSSFNTAISSLRQGRWVHSYVAVIDSLMTCVLYWAALHSVQPRVCQHIRRLSRRRWLLTRSLPVCHAVGTCSAGLTVPRRVHTGLLRSRFGFGEGRRVGQPRRDLCGVNAGRAENRRPKVRCLLAPAFQPLALVQPNDGFSPFLCVPLSICTGGVAG